MNILNYISSFLSDYVLVVVLLITAVYFTYATGGVQFRFAGEMCRLLVRSGASSVDRRKGHGHGSASVTGFQAFMVSIASRVGTGNLAGVATAIALGGAGSIFWMWVIALLGAASAFVESTLAQLFKERDPEAGKGGATFRGGPAYYILKGTGGKLWAGTFAVLITITFGLAFNSVQANTIADAFGEAFDIPRVATGAALTILTLLITWGGIRSIARFSQWVVPVMAVAYILLALFVICTNLAKIPEVFGLIFEEAFGAQQALGGTLGMALVMGTKRGLFSNEAGEGSTPNVAATASVSHPVKQGLIQALGVFTDTLLICTCTALIILCSGVYANGETTANGIVLTQQALELETGGRGLGETFVGVAIFFFAFTSIVANYYYGETNLRFLLDKMWLVKVYRLVVGAMVFIGSMSSLTAAWAFADITMALMTLCNVAALFVLGKWALICLEDYKIQKKRGIDPTFHSTTIPELGKAIEVWD
ncbi:MAG: alanine:cation symporter family protein [Muribaculaceae bacterium]|nr:alanine:cation symporter family protein [Muribaculaceae bacterium]